MQEAILSGVANSNKPLFEGVQSEVREVIFFESSSSFKESPTVYRICLSEVGSSGTFPKRNKQRKISYKSRRKLKGENMNDLSVTLIKKGGTEVGQIAKRKASDDAEVCPMNTQHVKPLMIPNEGLSKLQ